MSGNSGSGTKLPGWSRGASVLIDSVRRKRWHVLEMEYLIELPEGEEDHRDAQLQIAEKLTLDCARGLFPLNHFTDAHTKHPHPFSIRDVESVDGPYKGIYSESGTAGTWNKVRFRMFGHILIPRLGPISPSGLRRGRYHRHSIVLTGSAWLPGFGPYFDGLRCAGRMLGRAIGPGNRLPEPIERLRQGLRISITAPKVPPSRAATAATMIGCDELIEITSYSSEVGRGSVPRQRPIPWDSVLQGDLVEVEIYVRAAPATTQEGHAISYQLCSICVVDGTALQPRL